MTLLFFYLKFIFRHVFHFLYVIIGSQQNKKADSFNMKGDKTMAAVIIRQMDELGRIVIPKDLRKQYGFKPGEDIYFEAYDDGILIHRENYAYGDAENDEEN